MEHTCYWKKLELLITLEVVDFIEIRFFCVALCPDPVDPVNGMVTFTENAIDDTATYSCNTGFELVGSASVTCTQVNVSSATFSPAPPVCRRK